MKAIVRNKYCLPEDFQVKEIERPIPKKDEVLVKIYSTSLNAADIEQMHGSAMLRITAPLLPAHRILGSDFAGVVEATGESCTEFKAGDEVFGDSFDYGMGALAEYICVPHNALNFKPEHLSFDEAATLPQAGILAAQGMRKHKILPGQKVLINGAGGGMGTFAVQIAKYYGAQVWGVDSEEKLETMKNLGADFVIDYKKEDFTQNGIQYDLILDMEAHHPTRDYIRSLGDDGKYIVVGGKTSHILKILAFTKHYTKGTNRQMEVLMWDSNKKEDYDFLYKLIKEKQLRPVIDRRFELVKSSVALRYIMDGHTKGKVIIKISE